MTSTRFLLRAATRSAHARVDALFDGGLASPGVYHAYLLGMERLLRACDAAFEHNPPGAEWTAWDNQARRRHLAEDLAALGLAAGGAAPAMALASPAESVGALYVIEGSALGARRLREDVARLGFDAGHGAAFLSHHAGGPDRWPRFVAKLDALPPTLAPALQAGALAAFGAAGDAFHACLGDHDDACPQ